MSISLACTEELSGHRTLCVASQLMSTGGRITFLCLLATLLTQPMMLLAFRARARCWLMFNLVSTRTPRSYSAKLLSSWMAHSTYCCVGLSLPRCRTWHFCLLHFLRLLSAQFSSLSRSLFHEKIRYASTIQYFSSMSLIFFHGKSGHWHLSFWTCWGPSMKFLSWATSLGSEQPDLVEDIPDHYRDVGLDNLWRPLPTQIILWF